MTFWAMVNGEKPINYGRVIKIQPLSAPIRNYDDIVALKFFTTGTLSVEWIRSFNFFFGQDLQE